MARADHQGQRLDRRRELLQQVDSAVMTGGRLPVAGMDRFYEQAFDTLNSSLVNRAFDLGAIAQH